MPEFSVDNIRHEWLKLYSKVVFSVYGGYLVCMVV